MTKSFLILCLLFSMPLRADNTSYFEPASSNSSSNSNTPFNILGAAVCFYNLIVGESKADKTLRHDKQDLENQYSSWSMYDYAHRFEYDNTAAFKAHHLYRFTEFKRYLKQLPGVYQYISELNNQVKSGREFSVRGCDAKEFKKIVQKFARELQGLQAYQPCLGNGYYIPSTMAVSHTAQTPKAISTPKIQKIGTPDPALLNLYNEYAKVNHSQTLTPAKYIVKRTEALRDHVNCIDSYQEITYEVSAEGKKLLSSHSISIDNYELFYGNQIQRVLHQEFIDIINGAGNLYYESNTYTEDYKRIANTATLFAHAGHLSNKANTIKDTFVLADFCHGMLKLADSFVQVECDIGCAIGRGFKKGGANFAHTVIHPLDKAQQTLLGLGKLLISIKKTTIEKISQFAAQSKQDFLDIHHGNLTQWDILYRDAVYAFSTVNGACRNLKKQWELLNYQTTLLAIENTTAFATESALTSALLGGLSALTEGASTGLSNYVINNPPFMNLPFNATTFEAALVYKECAIGNIAAEIAVVGGKVAGAIDKVSLISPKALLLSNMGHSDDGMGSQSNKPKPIINSSLSDEILIKYISDYCDKTLINLSLKYDCIRYYDNNPIKFAYQHVFKGEIIKNGTKLSGLHHDPHGYLRNRGVIQIKKMHSNGFYQGEVLVNGNWITKTFFPDDWSLDDIMNSVIQALDNPINNYQQGAQSVIEGENSLGIIIRIVLNDNGQNITFYPLMS